MKRLALLALMCLALVSSSGCCLFHGCGYGPYGGCCPGGACGYGAGGYPGSVYSPSGYLAPGMAAGVPIYTAGAPIAVPMTAYSPLNPLPTY